MKKLHKLVLLFLTLVILIPASRADEGMWIPMLLKKYTIEDMQAKGFKLSAEDIYSINQASLKDAIVIFGGGCTGEIISEEGLLITNHHCGYGSIQRHSSVEHDYLTDGFWAMSKEEELPNPGLKVTFLKRMEDVTSLVLEGVTETMEPAERSLQIEKNVRGIQQSAAEGTPYWARIVPFFQDNQYFLFLYQDYTDVRLVGAPPSAIGKFGGETDNWMWPRHTGDFSLFRIYADQNNNPADYSEDNVPYKPIKSLPVSIKGVEKGDFTMVVGYPGRTTEYIPSFVIEDQVNNTIPLSIDLRTQRLDIIMDAMEISPAIRIQYSAKKSGIANGWKKNQGVLKGLKRLDAINRKLAFESDFTSWVNADDKRIQEYGQLLSEYQEIVEQQSPFARAMTFSGDAGRAAEIIDLAGRFDRLIIPKGETMSEEDWVRLKESMKGTIERHFRDYHAPTDQKLLAKLYKSWVTGAETRFVPTMLLEINEKYQGNLEQFASDLFAKSIFADEARLVAFLEGMRMKDGAKILKDPAFQLSQSIDELNRSVIRPGLSRGADRIPELNRLYMKAQMEMQPDKVFYPDANFTMRVTYGQVDDFEPTDGIAYLHYTTLEGIIEKDNPDIYDYRVPARLKELYELKDYGQYGLNGQMPVCFIASNHTSGGNSGSPVINAQGELIGVNFDRNWEGTMSDIMYDPDMCRNISIDIRYALFIIDKFAGAHHLIEEMNLVK